MSTQTNHEDLQDPGGISIRRAASGGEGKRLDGPRNTKHPSALEHSPETGASPRENGSQEPCGFLPDPIDTSVRGVGGLMLSIDWSTILQNSFLILEVQYYNHTKKVAFNWDIAGYGKGAISRPFLPKNYLEFYCISLILRGIIFFFTF